MFAFRADTIPSNIYVIGCGGTGSRLIPSLVQFVRSITREHVPSGWLGSTNIVLIDGDTVEQKNLLRQNFIQNDVGKNKAAVLANRYGKHFGMNVVAYPHFIEESDVPSRIRQRISEVTGANVNVGTDLVIMCVDSAKARRIVLNSLVSAIGPSVRTCFIDAGNEDSFGQVRMFHNVVLIDLVYGDHANLRNAYKVPERIELDSPILNYIPSDPEFYRTLQDNPGLGSCADLDQTLAINSLMAMYILSFVQNFYYRKVIDYNEISIDIVKGSTAYTKNTVTNYRNKAIFPDKGDSTNQWYNAGGGGRYGFLGSCNVISVDNVLGSFIRNNKRVVDTLIKEQERALRAASKKAASEGEIKVVDASSAAPAKKRAKKEGGVEIAGPTSNFRQLVERETQIAAATALAEDPYSDDDEGNEDDPFGDDDF